MQIQVCDRGSPVRCAPQYASVNVKVLHASSSPPVFTQTQYDVILTIPTCVGAMVTDDINAYVDDNKEARITYSIARASANNIFEIDQNSGYLYVANSEAVTSSMTYVLRISAVNAKQSSTAAVSITVTSIPEEQLTHFSQASYSASIRENLNEVGRF